MLPVLLLLTFTQHFCLPSRRGVGGNYLCIFKYFPIYFTVNQQSGGKRTTNLKNPRHKWTQNSKQVCYTDSLHITHICKANTPQIIPYLPALQIPSFLSPLCICLQRARLQFSNSYISFSKLRTTMWLRYSAQDQKYSAPALTVSKSIELKTNQIKKPHPFRYVIIRQPGLKFLGTYEDQLLLPHSVGLLYPWSKAKLK